MVGDDVEPEVEEDEPTVVLVTERGFGKRTPLRHFRIQKRGGLGLRALPYTERNGDLISMCQVSSRDDLMVLTDGGTVIRLQVNEIRPYSRYAKGVRIIALGKGEQVVSIQPVVSSGDDDVSDADEMGDGDGAEGLSGEEGVAEADASGEDAADASDEDAADASGEDAV